MATDDAFRDVLIAVDTFYAEVATSAVAAGAHLINDVSGGEFDENMHAEVRLFQHAPVSVSWLVKGMPGGMQTC